MVYNCDLLSEYLDFLSVVWGLSALCTDWKEIPQAVGCRRVGCLGVILSKQVYVYDLRCWFF